jgi:TonB-linked SusC/RagA family outer membrane protein
MKNHLHKLIKKLFALGLLLIMPGLINQLVAQIISVKGKVVDEQNITLPGVNIYVEKSFEATTTDANGNYAIDVDGSKTLVFQFMGMQTQKVLVAGKQLINVTMINDTKDLDEVVVIGYGTQVRGAITGSITKVNQKAFELKPIVNTLDGLQGALPGVTITRSSGRPGAEGYSMQIRGYSSLNGNKPLVLIDGIQGNLDVLNPNDIESVTVLKDAAASIYGARAADGVMIITTKKGAKGTPNVTYSYNFGIKTPTYLKKMTNTLQMAEMYDEGLQNVGQPGLSEDIFEKIRNNAEPDPTGGWMKYLENYPGFYGSTDWNDVVYGKGYQQMHNLSISGGNENNSYLLSAGYEKNTGIFKFGENEANRYNLRLNYDFTILNKIKLETRTTFDNVSHIEPSLLDEALRVQSRIWSYLPVYNPLDQFYKYQGYGNPASDLVEGGKSKSSYSRFSTNFKADAEITKGLKIVGQIGVDLGFWNGNGYYPTFNAYNWDGGIQTINNNPNSSHYANSHDQNKTFLTYLEFNKTMFKNHDINLMAGTSYETYQHEYQSTTGYNFGNNQLFTLNLSDKTNLDYTKNFTGTATENALSSYFGRFSYGFKQKLFLNFTMRVDGSSKFAPSKRWSAVFPAISLAYDLSQERFVKSLNFIDNLKIRASWGQMGNQDLSFGNYDYIPLIYIYGNYPLGSPNIGLQGAESSIASESRSWETIETRNLGIDFSILKSKLSGSFDYFIKDNKNMLVGVQLPATLGGTPPTFNVGKLNTKGWEAMLSWSDMVGNFKYSIAASISDSKNNLESLEGSDAYYEGLNYAREGYSLYSYFGYEFAGFIQNEEQLAAYLQLEGVPSNLGIGDVMYNDVDGDGAITAYGDPEAGTKGDMVYLGNKLPRYTYSTNVSLSFKNFDFNIFFQGVGKREGIKWGDFGQPFYWVWHQPLEYFYEKNWTPENTNAEYPRIIPGGLGYDNLRDWNWRTSAMRVDKMGYIRLKSITLAYNVPKTICNKIKMNNIRLFTTGVDLFTFSKGSWNQSFDPEEGRDDEQTYPFSKVISFGIEVKF